MEELVCKVRKLQKEKVSATIKKRLDTFGSFQNKSSKAWFSELCFCILTANSKAKTALKIQQELGIEGFCSFEQKRLSECIMRNKHRFHNNKSKYICLARKHLNIKNKIKSLVDEGGEKNAREWLAKTILGLGFKESSHFLRNVGYTNLAIIDRHVINLLLEHDILQNKPKNISKKDYLLIEKKLETISEKLKITQAELDLYLWYMKTGEVLK